MERWKVHEALKWVSSFLEKQGREQKAGEILLCHHLQVGRTKLFQQMHETLPLSVQERLIRDVHAHGDGVPVQHLTGEEVFYGRPFIVNGDVLIPRPETEELIVAVLETVENHFPEGLSLHVVDVGTGSGAIAVTLALENQSMDLSAVDISQGALHTAAQNAKKLGATVDFIQGDLLGPLIDMQKTFNVIISNPPYIPEDDFQALDPLVRDHEPQLALSGGNDGLHIYRKLIAQLPKVIAGPALVAFEVGIGQSQDVARLLENQFSGQAVVSVKKDINGKERIVLATLL